MKKATSIFLLAFYSFGIYFLPSGDFSALRDLPSMYRHCKATEDKDMTAFDFVTDHLIDIDCLFDQHDNGDEQRPHNPPPATHRSNGQIFCSMIFDIHNNFEELLVPKKQFCDYSNHFYYSDFTSFIFRPPIT